MSWGPWEILAATAAASAALGWSLRRFGGRGARSWAVPVAVAVLYGGAGYAFNLPDWLVVGGFLATPLVFHRSRRGAFERAALQCRTIALGDGAGVLVLRAGRPEEPGGVAAWDLAPEKDSELVLTVLEEEGEEPRALIQGRVPRGMSGVLCCRARDSSLPFDAVLAEREPLDGLPGLTGGMVVRALPEGLGFALLDIATLSALGDALELSTGGRDLRIGVSGPRLTLEATFLPEPGELRKALECAGKVLARMRKIGAEESAAGD